jgi:putative membrane protein
MTKTLLIAAKGVAMGAADVVPGVSGGTIALLTGIYPRLINAIAGINANTIKLLFKGQLKAFWKQLDGRFLLPLLLGIVTAFALLAHSIKHALEHYPIPTWSFFFGLIIASAVLIVLQIKDKKVSHYLWLIPGILFGYWISSMTSIPFPNSQFAVFIAGMIAVCAMILPGISGSFILLLLGMYQLLITAVAERQLFVLMLFVMGALIGLLLFSRLIKWILDRYYRITLLFLSGLMLGSLTKVWPWKLSIENMATDQHQLLQVHNVMPFAYPQAQLPLAISMMVMAIIVVFLVDYLGRKLTTLQN